MLRTWGSPVPPSLDIKAGLRAEKLPCCTYCDEPSTSPNPGLCSFHMRRKGSGLDLDAPRKRYNLGDPGYSAMRDKIRKERGRAPEYSCVDCGIQARDWVLRFDASIKTETTGPNAGRLFSQDIFDYEPRCRPCHNVYDTLHNLHW